MSKTKTTTKGSKQPTNSLRSSIEVAAFRATSLRRLENLKSALDTCYRQSVIWSPQGDTGNRDLNYFYDQANSKSPLEGLYKLPPRLLICYEELSDASLRFDFLSDDGILLCELRELIDEQFPYGWITNWIVDLDNRDHLDWSGRRSRFKSHLNWLYGSMPIR